MTTIVIIDRQGWMGCNPLRIKDLIRARDTGHDDTPPNASLLDGGRDLLHLCD
jgi:hypothetical protein